KRYGVTVGYIGPQARPDENAPRFSVIVYDQLESPDLWVNEYDDGPEPFRVSIVPAEHVRLVLEIAPSLNREALTRFDSKMHRLSMLMEGMDKEGTKCPKFLPRDTAFGLVCVDVWRDDENTVTFLPGFHANPFPRSFYGVVCLRGESRDSSESAIA